ncbi:MAG: DUF3822 family protein [Bacteroidetes bacterium]|nr:MAG: DUF3822 family protein [Bacteroidota bacterium]
MDFRHLAIDISEHACSIASLKADHFELLDCFLFEEKKDFQYKERLSKALEKLNIGEVEEMTVSWQGEQCTLIPNGIFQAENISDYLQLCYEEKISKQEVDFNRLFSSDMVNVYSIPHWLKSFFVMRYPRVKTLHPYTHLIPALENKWKKNQVFCLIFPERMILMIGQLGKLKFCNNYPCSQVEDVLYYLSFALKQQGIDQEIDILCSLDPLNESIQQTALQEKAKTIELFKQAKWQFEDYFTLKSHQFCV